MTKAFIDIETRKVLLRTPYQNPDRPQSKLITKRWQVFMIGVAPLDPVPGVVLLEGREGMIFRALEFYLRHYQVTKLYYGATRSFDEAVMKGIFINARRELLTTPGPWPHLNPEPPIEWVNLGPDPNPDGLSKDAPALYDGGQQDLIRKHCREDVLNLRVRYLKQKQQENHA